MREVTDTSLQQLYWACRKNTGFPGRIPDEPDGVVLNTNILKGLGLIQQDFEELDLPKESGLSVPNSHHIVRTKQPLQDIKACSPGDYFDYLSAGSSYSSPQWSTSQVPSVSSQPATPIAEIDMKDQFTVFSPPSVPVQSLERSRVSLEDEVQAMFQPIENVLEAEQTDVIDTFLDLDYCTTPSANSHSMPYGTYDPATFGNLSMAMPHYSNAPPRLPPADIIYDPHLSLWQGSLAAAHQSVAS